MFNKVEILLVDDHTLFLEGITNLLETNGHAILGTAGDGIEALAMARRLHPQLILMDIQMGNCDGITAVKLIKTELPEIKIVMLSMSNQDQDLFQAIENGASGYLLKDMDSETFLAELEKINKGEIPMASGLTAKVFEHFSKLKTQNNKEKSNISESNKLIADLTRRQHQVISLISSGKTYQETGEIIGISESTVKSHIKNICLSLNLNNKAEIIAFALSNGLVKK